MLVSSLTGIYMTITCVCHCDAYLEGMLETVSHLSDCGLVVCKKNGTLFPRVSTCLKAGDAELGVQISIK